MRGGEGDEIGEVDRQGTAEGIGDTCLQLFYRAVGVDKSCDRLAIERVALIAQALAQRGDG